MFTRKNVGFDDSFDVTKCLQQIEIPDLINMCGTCYELPSKISTMVYSRACFRSCFNLFIKIRFGGKIIEYYSVVLFNGRNAWLRGEEATKKLDFPRRRARKTGLGHLLKVGIMILSYKIYKVYG